MSESVSQIITELVQRGWVALVGRDFLNCGARVLALEQTLRLSVSRGDEGTLLWAFQVFVRPLRIADENESVGVSGCRPERMMLGSELLRGLDSRLVHRSSPL